MALGTLAAGYFLLRPPSTWPTASPGPASATAAIFDTLAARSQEAGFSALSGPWRMSIPDDHGGHEEARVETWTLLAHLIGEDGGALGLQLSIARLGLVPPHALPEASSSVLSALYRAHVILMDAGTDSVFGEERLSRGMGAAGHDLVVREVWLDDWLLAYGEGEKGLGLRLDLTVEDVPVSLDLVPAKPAEQVPQDEGLRGFAIPRLFVEGLVGGQTVQGVAVLNHAWGDVPLPGGAVANDLLSIQLDDGSDLSLIRTMRRDGRGAAVLDGMISETDAAVTAFGGAAYSMDPLPGDGRDEDPVLAATWRISGPGLSLDAVPLLTKVHEDFAFAFSSGLLAVTGTRDGRAVAGLGSLQSTGGAR
jgi:predicted secreted hydrolase